MKKNCLLVEGKNDQHVIWNLAERLRLRETFDVQAKDSYFQLLQVLPIILKSTNTWKRLGIVVDADVDLNAHWQAIRDILEKSGFYSNLPMVLPKEGLVCEPDDREQLVVGVWIMPDNQLQGMIEDFVIDMIPNCTEDPLLQKVDCVLRELEEKHLNRYKLVHRSKARIHTWLAWQDEPGMPMGITITKQILSTEHELCCRFVNWLDKMFACK